MLKIDSYVVLTNELLGRIINKRFVVSMLAIAGQLLTSCVYSKDPSVNVSYRSQSGTSACTSITEQAYGKPISYFQFKCMDNTVGVEFTQGDERTLPIMGVNVSGANGKHDCEKDSSETQIKKDTEYNQLIETHSCFDPLNRLPGMTHYTIVANNAFTRTIQTGEK